MKNKGVMVLFSILDYSMRYELEDNFAKLKMPFSVTTHGHGSASSEILDYLGIGESKKMVTISLLNHDLVEDAYKMLIEDMDIKNAGMGIAFCCDVYSMSSLISKICCVQDYIPTTEGENAMNENTHELIVAVVNKGYFTEVMDAAKEAGATGGTMIHARGLGTEEAEKFLGITIQPEKDVVLIVSKKDNKQAIMEAVIKCAGINTAGRGVCFSIPVDSTCGFRVKED